MDHVTSRDGTRITYDRLGTGPAIVLVSGGSVDRWSNAGLASALAADFTVFNYDRRGRGESGDTPPYAPEREIEDIAAVIETAGGSAHLYGSSSGAALALEATVHGVGVDRLALWEPPYMVEPRPELADAADVFHDLVAAGKREDAAEYFMARVVGLPPEFVAGARQSPFWEAQLRLAHTLEYDARIMGSYRIPEAAARRVAVPTLIATGGASFPFMHETADRLAELIPGANRVTLPAQEHDVDPVALADALRAFLAG